MHFRDVFDLVNGCYKDLLALLFAGGALLAALRSALKEFVKMRKAWKEAMTDGGVDKSPKLEKAR